MKRPFPATQLPRLVAGALAFTSLFALSCSSPMAPLPDEVYWLIDNFGAWLPSGDSVLYHRTIPSSDGPAGLYIISSSGGRARFVCHGDWGGPAQLECSPTARLACGTWGGQIWLINLDTGTVNQLTHTDNGAEGPSWSPSGDSIVYERYLLDPGESRDSAGLHILALKTGTDNPIKHNGEWVVGNDPEWSANGLIAIGGGPGIYLTDAKGEMFREITSASDGSIEDYPMWLRDGQELLFERYGHGSPRTFLINSDGTGLRQWPYYVQPISALSPDKLRFVMGGVKLESGRSDILLFTRDVSDLGGKTFRQLTTFVPADSTKSNASVASAGRR